MYFDAEKCLAVVIKFCYSDFIYFKMKLVVVLFVILFLAMAVRSEQVPADTVQISGKVQFKASSLIAPTALILYGVAGFNNQAVQDLNEQIRSGLTKTEKHTKLDNYLQYTPMAAVYALNLAGIKGKHNFVDRTTILATAYIISGSTVQILKHTINIERPDGSAVNSFPSGHTATAFVGAEFLYQEYKDVSVWYGVAGYVAAAGTGFLRMYNNRHWLTDVAAGAGIGILSTKIAYWVHPVIKRVFAKNDKEIDACALPYYNGQQVGLVLSINL